MNKKTLIASGIVAALLALVAALYFTVGQESTPIATEPQKPTQSVSEPATPTEEPIPDCESMWIGKTLPADYKTGDCFWSGFDEFESACPSGNGTVYWVESSGVDLFYGSPGKPTLEATDDNDAFMLCD